MSTWNGVDTLFYNMNKYLKLIFVVICSFAIYSCSNSDDEPSFVDPTILQQYKWVLRTSDDPLVDDDYEWAIFDDYVITLYFVSDYECVINYYRKHFDTDDGTSYTREAQTVKYEIEGNCILLDYSDYTETEFIYYGDMLMGNGNEYIKEEITSYDREWLNENYKHIELDPDESTSTAFKGLTEIYADTWGGVAFGNPQCDDSGRLTYYKSMYYKNVSYEYSSNKIVSKSGNQDYYSRCTYTLSNGLITSFVCEDIDDGVVENTEYYTIKYDSKKHIVQITHEYFSSTDTYNFKWNSAGDLYESNWCISYDKGEASYIYTYDYLPTVAQIPPMILGGDKLWWAFEAKIDPVLIMEGYFGNSMTTHVLKSKYAVMAKYNEPYERYNWSYSFDSTGRITKMTQQLIDLYSNGKNSKTQIFTFKWK